MAHYLTALKPTRLIRLTLVSGLLLLAACAEDQAQEITPAAPDALEQPPQPPLGADALEAWGQLTGDFCPAYLDDFADQVGELNAALRQVPEADSHADLETAQNSWRSTLASWAGTQACIANALPDTTAADHQNRIAWIAAAPAMAGFIDAIPGYEDSGLVHDETVEMTMDGLIHQHQITDDAEVAVGLYALEVLLFGIELRNRADFGNPEADNAHHTTRRSQMLLLLGEHLQSQAAEWQAYWQHHQPGESADRAHLLIANSRDTFAAIGELATRHDLSQPGLAITAEHDATWARGWLDAIQPWWNSEETLVQVQSAGMDVEAWEDLSSQFAELPGSEPDWAKLALVADTATRLLRELGREHVSSR